MLSTDTVKLLTDGLDEWDRKLRAGGATTGQIGSALLWKIAEMQIDDGVSVKDGMEAIARA